VENCLYFVHHTHMHTRTNIMQHVNSIKNVQDCHSLQELRSIAFWNCPVDWLEFNSTFSTM